MQYFYNSSVKNIISAFGIIFKDITFENDFGQLIKVPIHYSPKEKWLEFVNVKTDYDSALDTDITLPRMGFELLSLDYDSSRMTNPMSRIHDVNAVDKKYMFNRVPYNFQFELYLATRKFEDSLKIIEQIIPFFTPDLNLSIQDKADFGLVTDIPFILNNASFNIDWQGGFETRRTILWTLSFTAKGYLYSNVREQQRIKETIVKMQDRDFNLVYESLISIVEPRSADREDYHTIIDDVIEGPPPVKLSFDITSGSLSSIDEAILDDPKTILSVNMIDTGETMVIQNNKSTNLSV